MLTYTDVINFDPSRNSTSHITPCFHICKIQIWKEIKIRIWKQMQKLINLPFFHLHVQTLGQMVLKALEVARRVIRKNISILASISCQADIFPDIPCQGEPFSIFNLSWAHHQLLAPPPHHVWVFLSLLNADQSDHNF